MKKFTITILLTLLSISLVTAQTKPDVAVLGADPNNLSDPQSKLQSTGLFNTVDAINISSTTPSLSNLQQYDAVLVYYSDFPSNRNALGDVLADYVDSGGGVVIAEFALAASPFTLGGKWASKNYYAIQPTGVLTGRQTLGQVLDPNHPIMQGVTNLDGGSASFRPPAGSLHQDAVEIARWSDGSPLVVTREIDISSSNGLQKKGVRNNVKRADFGGFPVSDKKDPTGYDPDSDFLLLMSNVLLFVSDGFVATNSPPELDSIPPQIVNELETLDVAVAASDPDGNAITLTANNLPAFASFTDNGNGTGTILFEPGFDNAGVYPGIKVTATDDGEPPLSDTKSFTLTVNNVNQAPEIDPIPNQELFEGDTLDVTVSATDPEGDKITLTANKLPSFATFTDNGDGKGIVTFKPGLTDAGGYGGITVTASDGKGGTDNQAFFLRVLNTNRAPKIDDIPDQTMAEVDTFVVPVSATDPDEDSITLTDITLLGLPSFATFTDNSDGTGKYTFMPGPGDAGQVGIRVLANDGELFDDKLFILTVVKPNGRPIAMQDTYETIGNVAISADANTGVLKNDSDPENDSLRVTDFQSQSAKGGRVTMTEDGGFNYEPPPGFTGFDDFFYTVSDDQGSTSTLVTIEVKEPRIWFINNSAGGENNGTITDPFQSITDFNANQGSEAPNSQPGDIIYIVYTDSGPYTGAIALQDKQAVLGAWSKN